MKIKTALVICLALVTILASGCGLASGLMGGNSGTVSNLWSDVPPLAGATKANINIPLPVQILIQGFMQAANSDSSSDVKLDKFDFIVYTTSQTPSDVASFYTADKMKAAGWNEEGTGGCSAGGDSGSGGAGFCAFAKKGSNRQETVLLIMPVQDDQSKQTQVFYVRFEATQKTPTP
ncbi:MAG TPA: hypothetical protein VFD70_03975 [Anaerolineae bacterium]|nr:hypothetical protein [Anaerolineae bacterium]